MEGWHRGDWFDSTSQVWLNPSPNMRSLNAALLYPGVAMLESSRNYSVGRGTDSPFEQIGADWIDGRELAVYLNSRRIPGVRVYPTRFTPSASNLAGKELQGVRFVLTERDQFSPVRLGLEIAAALLKLYPGKISLDTNSRLIGSRSTMDALAEGMDPRLLFDSEQQRTADFLERRQKYLLYR
jgi:uncharacterized protein YbbC (DUF1343 family)